MMPRYQHGFSTGSGNDGKQPSRTGQTGHQNGPSSSALDNLFPNQKNQRIRRSTPEYTYLSSCLAMTIRWIWFVPS